MRSPHRRLYFKGPREKADFLDSEASWDATTRTVQELADRFRVAFRARRDPSHLAVALHRWVRDSIAYQHDPGHKEQFDDSETILRKGYDDCDGKSRLLVALVRALRGVPLQARIRPVFHGLRSFVHVQAELRWPGSENWKNVEQGGWVLAEVILRGCELGDDPEAPRFLDRSGRHILANPTAEELRDMAARGIVRLASPRPVGVPSPI
jgi:transglutaminase-like putative cysteine protease